MSKALNKKKKPALTPKLIRLIIEGDERQQKEEAEMDRLRDIGDRELEKYLARQAQQDGNKDDETE